MNATKYLATMITAVAASGCLTIQNNIPEPAVAPAPQDGNKTLDDVVEFDSRDLGPKCGDSEEEQGGNYTVNKTMDGLKRQASPEGTHPAEKLAFLVTDAATALTENDSERYDRVMNISYVNIDGVRGGDFKLAVTGSELTIEVERAGAGLGHALITYDLEAGKTIDASIKDDRGWYIPAPMGKTQAQLDELMERDVSDIATSVLTSIVKPIRQHYNACKRIIAKQNAVKGRGLGRNTGHYGPEDVDPIYNRADEVRPEARYQQRRNSTAR
ncbi:MAG: hypothetical protein ABIA62_05050 [Candidatus Woesearchaeota archaeon]